MKFSKILSAVAAIAAAGMMTTAASAEIAEVTNGDPALIAGTASWMVQAFNEGGLEAGKPATEYDIDYSKVVKVSVTFSVLEEDKVFWDNGIGGAMIISINGGDISSDKKDLWDKYNWPSQQWWGVNDADLGFEAAADKDIMAEKIGDCTYKITSNEFANPIAAGDASTIGCMQVQFAEWSGNMTRIVVEKMELLDSSDNVLITFDSTGKADKANLRADGASSTPSTDNNTGSGNNAGSGDTDVKNPSAGGNVDTGVEGVAAVVGIAALAAGAVVLSRKRK